jgi:hypothetical protein
LGTIVMLEESCPKQKTDISPITAIVLPIRKKIIF